MTDPAPWQLALATLAVAAGAVVQGSIGFGFALVAAPVVSLLAPRALPGALLVLALPLGAVMVARERASIHPAGIRLLVAGIVAGTPLGAVALRAAPPELLGAVLGAAIVAAAAASALASRIEPTTGALVAAGALSGAINTVAATGGPPVALLYQSRPGPELRATLAATFLVSNILSLAAAGVAGHLGRSDALLALAAAPGLAAGLAASRPLGRHLDGRLLRPAVIAFAAVAGAGAIVRAVL